MVLSKKILEQLIESKIMKIYEVPERNCYFEYLQNHYQDGTAFGIIELENEIIDDIDYNKVLGYFGVNFQHNIIAYYLLN